jgi:hypothetical protein
MLYFSVIGNHEKITPGLPYGAALTIFVRYKEQIDRVDLFMAGLK